MSPELQKKLWQNYPLIMSYDKELDIGLYLECDDGWFNIIDNLCRNIQSHIDWNNGTGEFSRFDSKNKPIEQLVADQIKEKYGGLRFYYYGATVDGQEDSYIMGMVKMAEALSAKTCEQCGAPGKSCGKGWVRTICGKCLDKENAHTQTHETTCLGIIPDTYIICGEDGNFCSDDCLKKHQS